MAITINGTTGISGVDGSAATPALQGADSNTGISFGTDTVTINTGGVARVTTDATGNVGIGTATPRDAADYVGLSMNDTAGSFIDLNAGGSRIMTLYSTVNDGVILAQSGKNIVFQVGTERARIDSSGNLLIGRTNSAGNAAVPGCVIYGSGAADFGQMIFSRGPSTVYVSFRNSTSGSEVGNIQTDGTSTFYVTSSDYRLKEQVTPMTGALSKNDLLNPVTYKWKSTGEYGQGFIAHELQAVFPDAATGEKDAVDAEGNPVYQGVDTSFLVGHLVACVKELKAELDSVKAELATLKGAA